MNCVRCGTPTANARFCPQCGLRVVRLPGQDERQEPAGLGGESSWSQLTRDASDEGRRALYAEAIGDKNQQRYMRLFDKFERDGKTSIGWHWPAFFFTFWWLLYRKMYGRALIYFFAPNLVIAGLGIAVAMLIPSFSRFAPQLMGLAFLVYLLIFFVLPPLFADASYYHHCGALITKARAADRSHQGQLLRVARGGGTSGIALVVVCVLLIPAIVGILAAVSLPAYQDYTVRAKAQEALIYGKSAAAAVGNYYEAQKRFPEDLKAVSFDPAPPRVLQDIQLDPASGALKLVLSSGPPQGRSFALVPSQDAGGRIVWKCQTVDMRPVLLPAECR